MCCRTKIIRRAIQFYTYQDVRGFRQKATQAVCLTGLDCKVVNEQWAHHDLESKYCNAATQTAKCPTLEPGRVELHLSGLIGTASQPDMQKIRIIGFFFENSLNWQFEVRLLLFSVRTCVYIQRSGKWRPSTVLPRPRSRASPLH